MNKKTGFILMAVSLGAGTALCGELVPPFEPCWPGAVKPAGWILDRAVAAKNGYTAHMDGVSEHFRIAWTTNAVRRGDDLQWYNPKTGSWSAEGGAYWFEGLVRLAWQLDDSELKAFARRRLDAILDHVDENSCGFLWWLDRRNPKERAEAFGKGDWHFSWVFGCSERAVGAYFEATGDIRAKRALDCAFGWSAAAERFGAGSSFVSGTADAWRLTKSPQVEKCLDVACGKIVSSQFAEPPWEHLADTLNFKRVHERKFKIPSRHGVNCQESLRSVIAAWCRTGDAKLRTALDAWFSFLDANCMLPNGVPVSDEEWGWAGAKRGTETCVVAAGLGTRIAMLQASGDGSHGDAAERIYFNAGAATVSRDFKRHVYFQIPNRTGIGNESERFASHSDEPAQTRYLRKHWPLCCSASLNRIIPEYVRGMWMVSSDGGVAATLYGPSTFAVRLPRGEVAFTERTDYPFSEEIAIRVDRAPGASFPLKLRIPGWCASPSATVNGMPVTLNAKNGFAAISRMWAKGDEIILRFSAKPFVRRWADMNDNGRSRISISCGPLLFAYPIPEKDDNTPLGEPCEPTLAKDLEAKSIAVVRRPMPTKWDWPVDAPVKLRVRDAQGEPLELVPYGCTKLRISAFPIEGANVVVTSAPPSTAGKIETLTPESGGTVVLLPELQRDIMSRASRADRIARAKAICADKKLATKPSQWRKSRPIVFRWRASSGVSGPWKIEIGRNADMSDARTWWVSAKKPKLVGDKEKDEGVFGFEIADANLELGRTYHWRVWGNIKCSKRYFCGSTTSGKCACGGGQPPVVSAVSQFITDPQSPRWIAIEGRTQNIRDIGGWKTRDGHSVRQGMAFRGQGLNDSSVNGDEAGKNRLTMSDVEYLKGTLGINTDLDLRTPCEVADMRQSPLGEGVTFIHHPSPAYKGIFSADGAGTDLCDEGRKTMAANFRIFCDERNYPIYFHCTGGADRTGSLAYVLLGVLGVDRHDIEVDWESTFYPDGLPEQEKHYNPSRPDWRDLRHFDNGFAAYGDINSSWNEGIVRYLRDCGITQAEIDRFRSIMLER